MIPSRQQLTSISRTRLNQPQNFSLLSEKPIPKEYQKCRSSAKATGKPIPPGQQLSSGISAFYFGIFSILTS
jgi:hypothetical protein